MENKAFSDDNNAQNNSNLDENWHIPRPTLARTSKSSSQTSGSNNSTQSAKSGSQLLTAANLAHINQSVPSTRDQNIQYYLQTSANGSINNDSDYFNNLLYNELKKNIIKKDPDSASIASSMHFTVVNMNTTRPPTSKRSFCRKHQLTILVMTMSALFTIGILTAIFLLEIRAKNLHQGK